MTDENKYKPLSVARELIVGRRLLRIAQTQWSEPVCHLPGIGDAFYCSIVFEIEGSGMYLIADDSIRPWDAREPILDANLAEHRMETASTPVGSTILNVLADQLGELYFIFDNGCFAAINSGYGWCLQIGVLSDLIRSTIDDAAIKLVDGWSGEGFSPEAP